MLHFKPMGTSQLVRATVTETEGGAPVESADVTFDVSVDGDSVLDAPIDAVHQANGVYSALLPDTINLEAGQTVLLTITVDDGPGRKRISRVSGSVGAA